MLSSSLAPVVFAAAVQATTHHIIVGSAQVDTLLYVLFKPLSTLHRIPYQQKMGAKESSSIGAWTVCKKILGEGLSHRTH